MAARRGITRRELLIAGSTTAIASQLPVFAWQRARADGACEPRPRFFTDPEDYRTLEALVDRLIPEDTDGSGAVSLGAKRAKVADYVDYFLGSFLCSTATPFLYAGGPFSDRNGSATNDMATPVALTRAQRIAWRVLILGSANAAENAGDAAMLAIVRANNAIAGVGDANGDSEGYQQLFARLLAALRASGFADLPAPLQDVMLERPDLVSDVMSAFSVAVEGMYANPEVRRRDRLPGPEQPPDRLDERVLRRRHAAARLHDVRSRRPARRAGQRARPLRRDTGLPDVDRRLGARPAPARPRDARRDPGSAREPLDRLGGGAWRPSGRS